MSKKTVVLTQKPATRTHVTRAAVTTKLLLVPLVPVSIAFAEAFR